MLLLPVMQREMLVEARQPGTRWSRLLIALAGMSALLSIALQGGFDEATGSHLFHHLNALYFLTIWLLLPLLTADALSQERRENTLGLLFLTGLTAREIVLGKSCAHALRGLNLLLAMTPFLIIPVVLGGLNWIAIGIALVVNLAAIPLALAAGMLASAVCQKWWRALPLALLLAALFLVTFSALNFLSNPATYRAQALAAPGGATYTLPSRFNEWLDSKWSERLVIQGAAAVGLDSASSPTVSLWTPPGNPPVAKLFATCLSLLWSGVLAWFILALAARIIAATWRVRAPSERVLRWQRFWFSARFLKTWLRRQLARAMNRNPVGWLHQRTWQSRSLKWGWFLAVAFIAAQLLNDSLVYFWELPNTLRLIGLVLLLNLAFTAAASFRQDLDNGTLELLLVSPLPEGQILAGRLRGVAGQYAPALALLVLVWAAVFFDLPDRFYQLRHELSWPEPALLLSTATAVLFIGVGESIHRRLALWNVVLTLAKAVALPLIVTLGIQLLVQSLAARSPGVGLIPFELIGLLAFCGSQLLLAAGAWLVTPVTLRRRESLIRHA